MKLTFIGATHEVTGSCYYLEAAGRKFLVDCGMEQGPDYYENTEIPVAPGELEKVSRDRFMPQMQPAISVISCFVTVHISRCSRQSGETVKADERANRNSCLRTRWKMPWALSKILYTVLIIK